MSGNELLLNPRLPAEALARFKKAWATLVEPNFKDHVGLATSGSSGKSFGILILLSRSAIEASARSVNARLQVTSNDIWYKSLPSFHVGGLGILERARLSQSKVFDDTSERWSVASFSQQVGSSKATLISLVPTQVFDLVQASQRAPAHVRAVIVGGGRLEKSLRLQAVALGWPCLPSFGMTETASQIATAVSADDPRLILLDHAEARREDDGRLAVRASSLLTAQISFGSDSVDEAQIEAQITDPKVDGWFTTADRGQVDGRILSIEGRAIDFVKVGGEGVIISRLEDRLEQLRLRLNFSDDVALTAAKEARLGATIVLLTTANESRAKSLVDEFNASVAPFERIRVVKVVEQIPRSPLGKLLRVSALRQVGLEPIADDVGN